MNKVKEFIYYHVFPLFGRVWLKDNHYCNVIYYHDIVLGEGETYMRTNIDVFKKHMQYIADNGYETIRFDDFQNPDKLLFKKKRILIAFDDGWLSNYDCIFEWMKERGIKYNVFLTIGEIGANPEYLTWDMVCKMHKSGLCGFGAHTFTHPDMSDLSKINWNKEIIEADNVFEKELGYKPIDFCYPFGYYSSESNEELSSKSNYRRIYTSQMIYSYELNGRIIMGRNAISNDDSFSFFKDKLSGYFNGVYGRILGKHK